MRNGCCPAPLDGPEKTADYLRHFGFERSMRSSPWFTMASAILGFLLLVALFWSYDRGSGANTTGPTTAFLSPLVTFLLLLGGYWQWQRARLEISMDKYYERLNIANQWWKSSPPVQKIMAAFSSDSEDPEVTMYVCLEIDNLEYVIEKYRIGYIDDEQACRALRAFQIRCLAAAEFRKIARRRIHAGDYTPRTAAVVCSVCDAVDRMAEHQRASLFVSGQPPMDRPNIYVAAAAAINFPGVPPPPPPSEGSRSGLADQGESPRRRASDVIPFASAASSSGSAASAAPHPVPRRRASDASHLSPVPRPDAEASCEGGSQREEGGSDSPSAAGGNP
jgi:hypothetical protein